MEFVNNLGQSKKDAPRKFTKKRKWDMMKEKFWSMHMKKGENKVSAPGYFKGLGGAVLGGILAFLMWVMTAYFVGGNLHLSFGFVLALFVYYGYFSFGGKKAKGFFAIYLPTVFLLGFLAAAVSVGIIHMQSLGFTGNSLPAYAAAYYHGNVLAAYFDTLGKSVRQVFLQFGSVWPYFAIGAIYEAVGAMCYGVRAGRQMIEEKQAQAEKSGE